MTSQPQSAPTVSTISAIGRETFRKLGGAALIAVAAVTVYWPALRGGFVLDDDKLVTDNDLVRSPGGLGLIWFSTQPQDYWPMTNSLFWLQWRVGGLNSIVYHITSVVLHIAAALLIWRILRILAIPGAFLAALLFAVHPVNVQSVAWISEQKNMLAMVFFLLSILWYLRAGEGRGTRGEGRGKEEEKRRRGGEETYDLARLGRWYWLSLAAFVLAMLSKGSVAVLLLVLLLIVWWQRQRITRSDLLRTAPFFVVAVALTAVNLWFQTHGSEVVVREVNFGQRLAGAGGAVWFYLSKAMLPIDLVFIYPPWQIQTSDALWWLPLLALVIATAVLCWQSNSGQSRWVRPLVFAWIFFCVALLPVLGFVDVGFMKFSLVADHYQHLAIIGVTALVAAGWTTWHQRARVRSAAKAGAVVVVGALMLLTWQQSRLFADAITLYRDILRRNPECWVVHNNLGVRLLETGNFRGAQAHFEETLRLKPDYPDAYNNLGNVLLKTGRFAEAIEKYQQTLRLKPNYPEPYANLALTYAQMQHSSDAIAAAEKALELARSQNKTLLAQRIEDWLTSYRAGQQGFDALPR